MGMTEPEPAKDLVLGHKRLTVRNWLSPDPVSALFVRYRRGRIDNPTADDFAELFLGIELSERVPPQVQSLFNVARGSMLYGYFYYPLYTLGLEQMYRVAEAAVLYKCRQMNAPKLRNYANRVAWLLDQGVISEKTSQWWQDTRRLRNYASHPEMQTVEPPGPVLGSTRRLAESVNALFDT
jgi:hypothetical protein